MCKEFDAILCDSIHVHWLWVTDQVADAGVYCHPLYTAFSPFCRFSDSVHREATNLAILILVNFDQHAILELPK